MSETIDDARRLIESRLAEIAAETVEIERALAHLTEGSANGADRQRRRGRTVTAKVPAAAPKKSAAPKVRSTLRRKATERAARGQRREQLLAEITRSPGARPSELAASIGIRPTQVSVLIAKLRGERLIVKRGKGYASKS